MSKLCERLRRFRAGCHMTQAEVAEQLHITRRAVSSYESGRTEPNLETLKRLAEIYGVSLEELLGTEPSDDGKAGRVSLWILRGSEAVVFLCVLVRSVLFWVANRFYMVPEGQVSPELRPILETRFSIMDAARGFESVLLLGGRWLEILFLIRCLQAKAPAKKLWKEWGLLVGGMLLAALPWTWADPFYGPPNYCDVILAVGSEVLLFLLVGLLVRWIFRKRI